jgi:YHS domain-containing protein
MKESNPASPDFFAAKPTTGSPGLVNSRKAVKEAPMTQDPVCGMQLEPHEAVGMSEYDGESYFFCSSICKEKFDANPERYARQPASRNS